MMLLKATRRERWAWSVDPAESFQCDLVILDDRRKKKSTLTHTHVHQQLALKDNTRNSVQWACDSSSSENLMFAVIESNVTAIAIDKATRLVRDSSLKRLHTSRSSEGSLCAIRSAVGSQNVTKHPHCGISCRDSRPDNEAAQTSPASSAVEPASP